MEELAYIAVTLIGVFCIYKYGEQIDDFLLKINKKIL